MGQTGKWVACLWNSANIRKKQVWKWQGLWRAFKVTLEVESDVCENGRSEGKR